jgi:hypothetical protein
MLRLIIVISMTTFEYINPDYSTRLSAKLLLAVLKNLEY